MINHKLLLFVFLLMSGLVLGQKDTLTPLSFNPAVQKAEKELSNLRILTTGNDTVELPFLDDFSYEGPFPDTAKWMRSNSVYVNRTFGRNPRTLGVATFDGLKSNGYPYKPYGSSTVENSDTLTSKYIRLDSLTLQFLAITPADSVYLSFYYQPRGFGVYPGNTHTLILDFFNPTTQTWVTKMTINRSGTAAYQAKDSLFTRVMIPITDPQFFKKDFRFRFRNKSAGTGSVNHWHIDNIYLNKGRYATDTIIRDMSYAYPGQTLLENYTSIPYEQYTSASQMASHSYLKIRNNDVSPVNLTGFMEVKDNAGSVIVYDTTGSDNALPFFPNGYVSNTDIIDPLNTTASSALSNFAFNTGNPLPDSITYYVKHSFSSAASDINKRNDTIIYKQVFHNYYAYDDGTAELAYGLQDPDFFGAETAVQYNLTNADTLRAIDIFFNPVPNPGVSVNQQLSLIFGLRVWADNGGVPGNLLYDDNNSVNRNPMYYQWGPVNYFTRYYLNYPLVMQPGVFYAGVKQDGTPSLNIGFDQNTNNQSKMFYNVGTWTNSSFKGSLMIRPVFGDSAWAATGVKTETAKKYDILIYPNPANEKLFISTGESLSSKLQLEIVDGIGKIQLTREIAGQQSIAINELQSGFYFVRIYKNGQLLKVEKIIIAH